MNAIIDFLKETRHAHCKVGPQLLHVVHHSLHALGVVDGTAVMHGQVPAGSSLQRMTEGQEREQQVLPGRKDVAVGMFSLEDVADEVAVGEHHPFEWSRGP